MVRPRQIRAARALLNWSQQDLATASGVAVGSIKNIENNLTVARKDTLQGTRQCLEKGGVEFLPNEGVSLQSDRIVHIEGENAFLRVLDDVIETMRHLSDSEALFFCVIDCLSPEAVIENYRRLRGSNIRMRSLVKEGDTELYGNLDEYRCIPEKFFHNNVQVVYEDKVATMLLDENTGKDIGAIIAHNSQIAAAQRNLFEFVWSQCPSPKHITSKTRY